MDRFTEHFGERVCAERPFFNFGAGNWKNGYFRNMDIVHPQYPNNQPDIVYDAFSMAPFPIETGSAQIFYFSHVNEHLTDAINEHVLSEVWRCLAPGGIVRICFPDFNLACRAHSNNDRSFFLRDWVRSKRELEVRDPFPITQLWLDFFATRAQEGSPKDGNRKYAAAEIDQMLNEEGYESIARRIVAGLSEDVQKATPACHINYWTHDKFRSFLKSAGFSRIENSSHLQSACPPLRNPKWFDHNMPAISGYIEAVKT